MDVVVVPSRGKRMDVVVVPMATSAPWQENGWRAPINHGSLDKWQIWRWARTFVRGWRRADEIIFIVSGKMAVGLWWLGGLSWLIEDGGMWDVRVDVRAGGAWMFVMVVFFMMGGALLVKLTRGTKMHESPENNLRTEDSICLYVFNLLLWDCALWHLRSDLLKDGAKRQ